MKRLTIDPDALSRDQLISLLNLYDECIDVILAANNTLLLSLSAMPGVEAQGRDKLSEWSVFINHATERFALAVEAITQPSRKSIN